VMVDQHRGTAGVTTEVDEPLLVVVQVNPAMRPGDVAQFLLQRESPAVGREPPESALCSRRR
jgi:hypothetical protein